MNWSTSGARKKKPYAMQSANYVRMPNFSYKNMFTACLKNYT